MLFRSVSAVNRAVQSLAVATDLLKFKSPGQYVGFLV